MSPLQPAEWRVGWRGSLCLMVFSHLGTGRFRAAHARQPDRQAGGVRRVAQPLGERRRSGLVFQFHSVRHCNSCNS